MVQLVPMTDSDFRSYVSYAVPNFALESVQAGNVRQEASEQFAQGMVNTLLPQGLTTQGQFLYTVVDEATSEKVGYLWFGLRDDGAGTFAALYDFVIFDDFRRKGYGAAAMRALEAKVKSLGLHKIALHVFGHNSPARVLYKKLGYVETDVTMAKVLGG